MTRNRILGAALAVLLSGAAQSADLKSGVEAFDIGEFALALAELTPLADAGEASAQFVLGVIYLHGLGVEPDPAAAAERFRQAAEQDEIGAQLELARMYRDGIGVANDQGRMVHWYRRAAELGDVGAQLFLADSYAFGLGVDADPVKAYMWYEIARRYWGDMILGAREAVAERMSADQIAEATRLARGWSEPAGD